MLVISPLLTSAVVRTYGWIAILAENGLVNNVRWLISTYNLVTPSGGVAIGSQPAQKPVQKTVQVYSETPTPFYFDTEKWDLPMKKLREFGQKKKM